MVMLFKEKILNKKTLLSLLVGFIVLYFLLTKLDFAELLNIIKNINIFYFILSLFISFSVFPLLALRWQVLLRNVGLKKRVRDLNEIVFLSNFINCIVPAKAGELYRAYLIKKNYRFSMSKTIGTIFVERLIDMAFLIALMIISIEVVFRGVFPAIVITPVKILLILTIIFIILAFVMKHQRKRIMKILPKKIKKIFGNFERGISGCLRWRDMPLIGSYSVLRWFIQIMSFYFIILAINLKISFFLIVFITLASALITLIPITPGGLGMGELAIAGILVMFSVEKNLAISASILIRFIGYWCVVLVGSIVYMLSSKK